MREAQLTAGARTPGGRYTTLRAIRPKSRPKAMSSDTARSIAAGGALFVTYAALWAASAVFLRGRSDLDLFFWPTAQAVVSGHPFSIYASNNLGAGPYANGPLGLVPLIPLVAIADAGGWAGNIPLRAAAANAVYSVGSLLMAVVALRLIHEGRGSIEWRLAALCAFLLAPTLWVSVASFGHFEQPIELCLVLLAAGLVMRKRFTVAGLALGLALLTRTTALLYAIPLAMAAASAGRLKAGARLIGLAALIAVLGLTPFIISRAPSVLHALVGYRGDEPIGGGSLWAVALGTPWALVVQHIDTYLALVLAVVLCAVMLVRNPRSASTPAGLCGLLAVAATLFPMLAKTAYPYYFVEPYVFVTIWWLARPGRALNWRAVAPLLVTLAMLLAQQSTNHLLTELGVAEGVCASAALLIVLMLVSGDLLLNRMTVSDADSARPRYRRPPPRGDRLCSDAQ